LCKKAKNYWNNIEVVFGEQRFSPSMAALHKNILVFVASKIFSFFPNVFNGSASFSVSGAPE
jgi:hypothetical protein